MAERRKGSAAKLRALEGQVHQFDVPGEMTGLLLLRTSTGDLLVVDAGVAHDISAEEASVLLLTVASAEN